MFKQLLEEALIKYPGYAGFTYLEKKLILALEATPALECVGETEAIYLVNKVIGHYCKEKETTYYVFPYPTEHTDF